MRQSHKSGKGAHLPPYSTSQYLYLQSPLIYNSYILVATSLVAGYAEVGAHLPPVDLVKAEHAAREAGRPFGSSLGYEGGPL